MGMLFFLDGKKLLGENRQKLLERPFLEPEQSFQCIFLLNQFSSLVHFHKMTVF